MESPSCNLSLKLNQPSSLVQGQSDTGTQYSHQLYDSNSSVVSTIRPTSTCTFIIPSRRAKPPRNPFKEMKVPLLKEQEIRACIHSHAESSPTDSTFSPPEDAISQEQHNAYLSESSSSGTFGRTSIQEQVHVITASSPKLDQPRRIRSFPQRSPPAQPLISPTFSTPLAESFSDSSTDGIVLLTPMNRQYLSNGGEMTQELDAPDTRASLFTISAYSRSDNLKTPVVCSESTQQISKTPESAGRISFTDAIHISPRLADAHHIPTIYSPSTLTLHRPHHPSPLAIKQEDVPLSYPMVVHNSQDTASATNHSDLEYSSTLEGPPVPKLTSRGARHIQPSAVPSLPIVEFVKRACIELRVDQEGHRTFRPQFIFKRHIARTPGRLKVGIRPSTSSKSSDSFWDNVTANGLVDFRMSAKEVGTFHCGTISREAILRRLVVDGKDHRDHLTANVVLPLKENGVYTVHGIERERKKSEPKTLVWKFEYTVEDKRVPQTGQPLAGEKLLRPISFICSPELLLPSQSTGVTIMHLITKKFAQSPTAMHIPPPVMPSFGSVSATNDGPGYPVNLRTVRPSSRKRRGSIGLAFKSLSRPTTPATDRRLRDEFSEECSSSGFSRRLSISRSFKSDPKGDIMDDLIGEHPRSLSEPMSRRNGPHKRALVALSPQFSTNRGDHSYHLPLGWMASLGQSVDSLPLASSKPQRPHTTESPIQRSYTSGFAFGKSLKHVSGVIAGKMVSMGRPATTGSQPRGTSFSRHKRSSFPPVLNSLGGSPKLDTRLASHSENGTSVLGQSMGHIPTDQEIDEMLLNAQRFIATQHQRLETLVRSRGSGKPSFKRIDSGDISTQSDSSYGPPQTSSYHITGRFIVSPRILQSWAAPSTSTRRPYTAGGASSENSTEPPLEDKFSTF